MKIKDYTNREDETKVKNSYLLYARKSSESEDRQADSIPAQLDALHGLATQKKLNVIEQFTESRSAKAPGQRKEFERMLETIDKNEEIKGIVCWKLNRLSRNPIDTGKLQWMLQQGKIKEIVTPNKTYTIIDSDLVMGVEGAMANRFITDLREDTARGIQRKLDKGHAPIFAPTGYKNDIYKRQGEKTISGDRKNFDLMREIFRLAMTGRFTTNALYKNALDMGLTNSKDNPVSRSQMYDILRNPFYCGKFIYGNKLYQGAHKPMITENEFDGLQEILDGRTVTQKITQDFILRGFVKCGYCGYQIIGERHTKKSGLVFEYYTCCMRKKGKKCLQPYVRSELLEEQFLSFLSKIRLSESFVKWAIKWLRSAELQDNEVRKKQLELHTKEYDGLGNQINKLMDKLTQDTIGDQEYLAHKQRYLQQRTRLNRKIKNFDKDWTKWTELSIKTFEFANEAQEKWSNGSLQDKQLILSIIGSNFVLKDKKLTIQPKTPFLIIENALSSYQSRNVGSNPVLEPNIGVEDFGSTVLGD